MQQGSEITVEPPYSTDFDEGYIYYNKRVPRRYVQLINTETRYVNNLLYSRYLFQIDYWKKGLGLIPDGYEVDHINDDPLDDRLDNFQLLPGLENLRKRDIAIYRNNAPTSDVLKILEYHLKDGQPYRWIREKLGLTPGHLRYLITTHCPAYTIANKSVFDINKEDIRSMLSKDTEQHIIADIYGVDQATISRYIADYFPEYTHEKVLARKLDYIRTALARGVTATQIALDMKCDVSNISYYTTKYFPEYQARLKEEKEKEKRVLIAKVKELCDADMTQRQMATVLDVAVGSVNKIIAEHFPEYQTASAYEIRVKRVGELLTAGKSKREIATELDVFLNVVADIINRHYSEKSASERQADKLAQFRTLMDSGEPHTLFEITTRLDLGYVTASQWLHTYYPEREIALRTPELKQQILAISATSPELNNLTIAQQTNAPYFYVGSLLRQLRAAQAVSP